MQSFKYSVPTPPEKRPGLGRFSRLIVAVAALALVGGGLWYSPLPGMVAGSMGSSGSAAESEEKKAQAAQLLRQAGEHMKRGEFMAAAVAYERVLALQPGRVEAYRRALDARYLEGASELKAIEALLPGRADRQTFFLALGEAERQAGRLAPALEAYQAAIALAPQSAEAHVGQGRALEAAGRVEEAIASYETARALSPRDLGVGEALIQARYRHGQQEAGIAEAEALFGPLVSDQADERVHIGVIEAAIRRGQAPEEIRARHQAQAAGLAPATRQLYEARAYMRHFRAKPHWNQRSFELAIAAASAARKAGDKATAQAAAALLARAHAERSRHHFDRGDFEASRREIERALALKAHFADRRAVADLYVRRGQALALGGKKDGLAQNMEYALQTDPTHPCRTELARSYANVGVGFLSIRRAHQAIKPLTRALQLTPDDPQLFARLHQALVRSGRPKPLATCGQAAGLKDPGDQHLQLVRGLLAINETTSAKRAAATAARSGLTAPAQGMIKAELAQAENQLAPARQALSQALAGRAGDADAWRRLGELDHALAEADADRQAEHLGRARESYRHMLALGRGEARGALLTIHQAIADEANARGDFKRAAAAASQGRLLEAHHPGLALSHGTALAGQKRHQEAIAALHAGLIGLNGAAHPDHAALRERLGQIYRAQKRYAEAITELKTGLSQEAKAPPARCATLYYELAFALADHGDREEALDASRQYVFWSLHDPRQAERVEQIQKLESRLAGKP
ncbi:MAG: tetratricopeptide repeat protein [Candidatus Sericytochromatia bacterium]